MSYYSFQYGDRRSTIEVETIVQINSKCSRTKESYLAVIRNGKKHIVGGDKIVRDYAKQVDIPNLDINASLSSFMKSSGPDCTSFFIRNSYPAVFCVDDGELNMERLFTDNNTICAKFVFDYIHDKDNSDASILERAFISELEYQINRDSTPTIKSMMLSAYVIGKSISESKNITFDYKFLADKFSEIYSSDIEDVIKENDIVFSSEIRKFKPEYLRKIYDTMVMSESPGSIYLSSLNHSYRLRSHNLFNSILHRASPVDVFDSLGNANYLFSGFLTPVEFKSMLTEAYKIATNYIPYRDVETLIKLLYLDNKGKIRTTSGNCDVSVAIEDVKAYLAKKSNTPASFFDV